MHNNDTHRIQNEDPYDYSDCFGCEHAKVVAGYMDYYVHCKKADKIASKLFQNSLKHPTWCPKHI